MEKGIVKLVLTSQKYAFSVDVSPYVSDRISYIKSTEEWRNILLDIRREGDKR